MSRMSRLLMTIFIGLAAVSSAEFLGTRHISMKSTDTAGPCDEMCRNPDLYRPFLRQGGRRRSQHRKAHAAITAQGHLAGSCPCSCGSPRPRYHGHRSPARRTPRNIQSRSQRRDPYCVALQRPSHRSACGIMTFVCGWLACTDEKLTRNVTA